MFKKENEEKIKLNISLPQNNKNLNYSFSNINNTSIKLNQSQIQRFMRMKDFINKNKISSLKKEMTLKKPIINNLFIKNKNSDNNHSNIIKTDDNQSYLESINLEENLKEKIDNYFDECEKLEIEILKTKNEIKKINQEIQFIKDKTNNQNKIQNFILEIKEIKKENEYYEKYNNQILNENNQIEKYFNILFKKENKDDKDIYTIKHKPYQYFLRRKNSNKMTNDLNEIFKLQENSHIISFKRDKLFD